MILQSLWLQPQQPTMFWHSFVQTEQVMLPRKAVSSCADTEMWESQEYPQKHRTIPVHMKTESQPAHLGWWRSHLKRGDERASTMRPDLVHVAASSLKLLSTFITGTHLF